MPDAVLYAAALFPTGLSVILVATTANATMQLGVEPEMRGRVMSIYTLVFLGGTPVGAPLVGWIGQHVGPRWAVGMGGLVSAAAAVFAAYALARAKDLSLRERLLAHSPARVAERFAS
jgi:MFS family permease